MNFEYPVFAMLQSSHHNCEDSPVRKYIIIITDYVVCLGRLEPKKKSLQL